MAETITQALDVQQLLLGSKGDVARCLLLRRAQGRSVAQRRQLERLVIELMENPMVDGAKLGSEEAALVAGTGLWALGRLDEAIANLTTAETPEADFFLGQCYLDNGHFGKAADAFERAQRGKGATKRLAALGAAEATAKGGKPEAALTAARAIVRSHPDDPAGRYLLGLCLDLSGRYEDAVPEYEKAVELASGHPAASFRLGFIESLRGDEERALEHYGTLAACPAVYVNALMNLGVLCEDLRDYDRAIECYRQVLRVDPNHTRARMFLKDAHASLDMAYDDDRQRELERREKLMGIPVSDFEFSVRVRNCLQRIEVETLGDLCRMTEEELLASKNFGETSLQEIKEVLQARGLHLGDAREEAPESIAAGAVAGVATGAPGGADQAALATPISELNLSMRSRKCMERLGITTLGQLVEHSEEELLASRNFGRTSLNEVNDKLTRYGLHLKAAQPDEAAEDEDEDADAIEAQEEILVPDTEHDAADEGE